MSTRCNICMIEDHEPGYDVPVLKIAYCHHDGYPLGVGKTLHKHYQTTLAAKMLMLGGDMSSLEPAAQDCTFYNEGEHSRPTIIPLKPCKDNTVLVQEALEALLKWDAGSDREYNYLWTGAWWIALTHNGKQLDLPAIIKEDIG